MVTPVDAGILRKRREYILKTSYSADRVGAYHLVLPEQCVPDIRTFQKEKPQDVKKADNRVALTWTFTHDINLKFTFREVSDKEFQQFKPVGVPITMKLSPAFKASLQNNLEKIKDEGEEFLAKALAEFLLP